MAITPKTAFGNKPDILKNLVDLHEKQIDEVLARDYDGRSDVKFTLPASTSDWVVRQLVKRFALSGWMVDSKRMDKSKWDRLSIDGGESGVVMTFSARVLSP